MDNAEAPDASTGLEAPLDDVAGLLPQMVHGQVLVTSRDASWEQHATLAELDVFTPDEAADFLLALLFLCCHLALSPPSQVALTLRAVGGLTTAQVAGAFLVPEATMAQRISRAKQRIKAAGARSPCRRPPSGPNGSGSCSRCSTSSSTRATRQLGADLQRADLASEAIRLARALHRLLPEDGEVAGLLALMLLTDARRPARTRPDGSLVPLAEQDRSRWDAGAIAEGVGPGHRGPGQGAARPLPAPGGHRRRPRRGGAGRGHGLAADPGPVRAAGAESRPARW